MIKIGDLNRCSGIFQEEFSEFGLAHAFKFVNFRAYSPFLGQSSFIHWTVHLSDHTFEFFFNHPFPSSKSFIYGEIPGVKGLDRFFTGVPFLRNIAFFNSEMFTLLRESWPGSFSAC